MEPASQDQADPIERLTASTSGKVTAAVVLLAYILLVSAYYLKGLSWATRVDAKPAERVLSATELRERLIAMNSIEVPFQIESERDGELVAIWRYADAKWIDTGMPGIRSRVLAVDKARSLVTLLIRAEPGAVYPSHKHHGPEDCYIISGSVVMDGRVLRAGDFHHADADSEHGEIATTDGAEVLIVGSIEDYLPAHAR